MAGHKAQVTRQVPPWHTWGNVVTVARPSQPGNNDFGYQQILRVAYGRPESWRFLLFAEPFGFAQLPGDARLEVFFQLMTGVGRSVITLPTGVAFGKKQTGTPGTWGRFRFDVLAGADAEPPAKWTTYALPPPPNDGVPSEGVFPSEVIVGQDIQIGCYMRFIGGLPGRSTGARIGAVVAPWHHARPDWTAAVGNFSKGELVGS